LEPWDALDKTGGRRKKAISNEQKTAGDYPGGLGVDLTGGVMGRVTILGQRQSRTVGGRILRPAGVRGESYGRDPKNGLSEAYHCNALAKQVGAGS